MDQSTAEVDGDGRGDFRKIIWSSEHDPFRLMSLKRSKVRGIVRIRGVLQGWDLSCNIVII